MSKRFYAMGFVLTCFSSLSFGHAATTHRIQQFQNSKVNVWKTIVYPSTKKTLAMHRHEYDRVVVALTDGTLKVKNDKGKIHYLHFKKNQAYYLKKDVPNELHSDQNLSKHAISVMVIELKY